MSRKDDCSECCSEKLLGSLKLERLHKHENRGLMIRVPKKENAMRFHNNANYQILGYGDGF